MMHPWISLYLVRAVPILVAVSSRVASAQDGEHASRAKVLGINVVIGGVTAGASQAVRRGSFWKGLARGSAGGAAVFAGKCLMAQQTTPGSWIGRGTVALGSSVIANASAGRSMFQRSPTLPPSPKTRSKSAW